MDGKFISFAVGSHHRFLFLIASGEICVYFSPDIKAYHDDCKKTPVQMLVCSLYSVAYIMATLCH